MFSDSYSERIGELATDIYCDIEERLSKYPNKETTYDGKVLKIAYSKEFGDETPILIDKNGNEELVWEMDIYQTLDILESISNEEEEA